MPDFIYENIGERVEHKILIVRLKFGLVKTIVINSYPFLDILFKYE